MQHLIIYQIFQRKKSIEINNLKSEKIFPNCPVPPVKISQTLSGPPEAGLILGSGENGYYTHFTDIWQSAGCL